VVRYPPGQGRPEDRDLVITADKGLAGGYNLPSFATSRRPARRFYAFPIGLVGKRYLWRRTSSSSRTSRSRQEPTVYEAKEVAAFAASQFLAGKIDEFHVIYTRCVDRAARAYYADLLPSMSKTLPRRRMVSGHRVLSLRAERGGLFDASYRST